MGKGVKYTLILWTFGGLFFVISFGVQQEYFERLFPSPHEWSWNTRRNYRSAKWADAHENEYMDWARQGENYRNLIKRLEASDIDGKGVVEQEEGGTMITGVGEAGFDITAKSEPWRRGYHDCLMGAAKAAEHLDGMVRDKVRNIAFPANSVIGPSNPNPRPLVPGAPAAPREEDCEPGFDPPETYYMKILTTHGFTRKQQLDAALAYASWLDYKGTPDAAKEMFKWALDIVTPEQVFDGTGQLNPDLPVTPNLLSATTAIAVHQARTKNVEMALPLFLSILRARKSLATPPPTNTAPIEEPSANKFANFVSLIQSSIKVPDYPPPPPSGDDIALRTSDSICEEAGLMTYIGEILYASATNQAGREHGLAWTREAVDISEETLHKSNLEKSTEIICRQCLDTGLSNWKTMVAKLAEKEKLAKEANKGKSSWLGFGGGGAKEEGVGRWESEEILVKDRMRRAQSLLHGEVKVAESGYLKV